MEWINDIQKAINYIENNLTGEIKVELIAKYICSSNHHFQKMFNMVTGITMSDYIRSRRLSLAANELKYEKSKVIDVALKYGYTTHESFTKAFMRFHGITPSNVSKSTQNLKYFYPLSIQINIRGGYVVSKNVMSINVYLGYAVLPIVDNNRSLGETFLSKIINLRKELKNDFNIDMPAVQLMDNANLSPSEIVIEIDGNIDWRQDFAGDKNFEAIGDTIIYNLKNTMKSE